ncbi:hypothetical protein PR202_gb16886 [Eleusine coracana subsp. coracana]|uniref:Uncharacterized protein n=1 Tax=Eleusine coracana subsp. coracana TaxID=191504 RepID=A0AAV5F1J1_ELECO|nr:hypothetical protein PR202_gb16886 [Eleusine coracana subsp. coracana]
MPDPALARYPPPSEEVEGVGSAEARHHPESRRREARRPRLDLAAGKRATRGWISPKRSPPPDALGWISPQGSPPPTEPRRPRLDLAAVKPGAAGAAPPEARSRRKEARRRA